MGGVASQQIRAQHQQADSGLVLAFDVGQVAGLFGEQTLHARVVDANIGVFLGCLQCRQSGQLFGRQLHVALHQHQHHVHDVVLGTGQPILHHQEKDAHVLRRTGNEAQQLGQAAQHGHLLGPGRRGFVFAVLVFGGGAQFFQQADEATALGVGHVLAHAAELHDLGCRHDADHGVHLKAALLQDIEDGQEMVFHEQHRNDDHLGLGQVVAAVLQLVLVVAPVAGSMHFQAQAQFAQLQSHFLKSARQMVVHGDQHHGVGGGQTISG